jgi:peptide methionine sulfoxide reductase MsrB
VADAPDRGPLRIMRPQTDGSRYCMNGVALSFAPNETSER